MGGANIVLNGSTFEVHGSHIYDFENLQPFTFTITVTVHHESTAPITITDDLMACGITGWTVIESGGTTLGKGTAVSNDCAILLTEGDSFFVGVKKSFTVPAVPSVVSFTYSDLTFDTGAAHSIKDAFEVALVDASGRTLVYPITNQRNAFLNASDGQGLAEGSGTTVSGDTVTLDISMLTPGSTFTFVVRLINNDADTNTTVLFDDFALSSANPYTKFFVVDSAATQTFRYDSGGTPIDRTSLNAADTAPRGGQQSSR